MFRSCDLQVHAELLDSTVSQIFPNYTWLGASDEDGLYLMARGTYSPQGAIIREVEFAARPSLTDGCNQPAPDYRIVARGVGPDWQVKIMRGRIEGVVDSGPAIAFPSAAPRDSGGAELYEASSASGFEEHTLRLLLQRSPCFEGKRAYTSMRAEAVLDGRVLTGCAWHGTLPRP